MTAPGRPDRGPRSATFVGVAFRQPAPSPTGSRRRDDRRTHHNPLLDPSDLPFELPPFDQIAEDHYAPAFDAGMAEHRAEVDAIVAEPRPPTFENTIVALERAGRLLNRTSIVLLQSDRTNSTPTPARHRVRIRAAADRALRRDQTLDPRLFARIEAVHRRSGGDRGLDAEAAMLVERYHLDFVLAGAGSDDDGRARLAELNQRLSTLSTSFQQNLLQATEDAVVLLDAVAELDGLSPDDAIARPPTPRPPGDTPASTRSP